MSNVSSIKTHKEEDNNIFSIVNNKTEPKSLSNIHTETKSANFNKRICCCGPGKKRHLIPLLCTAALTIVIGMRSEMLGIISNIRSNSSIDSKNSVDENLIFKPSKHRKLPWKDSLLEDFIENAVFFANMVGSPIGGYLTVNHDPSLLLGSSVAMTCGFNLFLPLVATIGSNDTVKITMVIIMRIFQGLAEGCLIPAIFGVLRFWAPVNERSSIICFSVIGVSLGPLIGLPLCAAIETKWGWGVVFYIYANLGLVWCIFWWRLVDERPSRSKAISAQERDYLLSSIDSKVEKAGRNLLIPWRGIFRSKSIYAILFTYAADDWTFQITSVCMQSYYDDKYHSDIENTINLLVYPFLARSIFVPAGGAIADILGYTTNLSWTVIRKMLTGIGFSLKGLFFITMAFAKDEKTATIMLSLCLGFSGIAVAGYAVNVIEIAPNYAGLIMGIASGLSTFTGIGSTVIASLMVQSMKQYGWVIALCSAGVIQIFSMCMYIWIGSCKEEPWAFPDIKEQNLNNNNNENT